MRDNETCTEQEEIYAQCRARGFTKTKSAQKAYPDTKYPRQMGYEAEQRPRVRERIRELKEERAEVAGLDVQEQVRRYTELYQMALEDGKIATAAKMLERIDAIGGFDAPSKSISISKRESVDSLKDASGDIKGDIERFSNILEKHSSKAPPKDPKKVH